MMKYLLLLAACLMCIVQPALAATKKGKQRSKEAAAERKKEWAKDPKHCEVCLKVMTAIHDQWKTMSKKDQKNKEKIETKIEKFCSKKNKAAGPKERKLCYYLLPIKRSISTPMAFGADPKGICKKLERTSAEVCAIKVSMAQCGGEMVWGVGVGGFVLGGFFVSVFFLFYCRFSRLSMVCFLQDDELTFLGLWYWYWFVVVVVVVFFFFVLQYSIDTGKKSGEPVNYKKMRVKHLKQILRERGVTCRGCTDKREFIKKCQDTEHLSEEM